MEQKYFLIVNYRKARFQGTKATVMKIAHNWKELSRLTRSDGSDKALGPESCRIGRINVTAV